MLMAMVAALFLGWILGVQCLIIVSLIAFLVERDAGGGEDKV